MSETKRKVAIVKENTGQYGTWNPNMRIFLFAGIIDHGDVEAFGFGGRHSVNTVETS